MKSVWELTKKELNDYFSSAIAYIVLAVFALVTAVYFVKDLFITNQADMRTAFEFMPLLLIIIIPALTMRSMAEERKSGTMELLLTAPISDIGIITAKFTATLIFTVILLLSTFVIPLTLNILGNPDNGVIVTGYLGLILLSSAYISIGQLVSINSKNQIAAFILSTLLILIIYILGEPEFLKYLPNLYQQYIEGLGFGAHFRSIARGVIDSRDVLYYLSIILIMNIFSYLSLQNIRQKGR